MGIQALAEKVNRLNDGPDEAIRGHREEWVQDVEQLYRDVELWLSPLEERIRFHHTEHLTAEQGVGSYRISHLTLFIDGVAGELSFVPVGSQVVAVRLADGRFKSGIRGRVSLGYGSADVPFVRVAGQEGWWVSTPEQPELHPLDQDTLAGIIEGLLDGDLG